ncbi:MAG: hypothetical protein LCH84_05135 [Gemmatimonadetes bacterium]|nr:hypothetical protein [Gemmatimonadota bacterium]
MQQTDPATVQMSRTTDGGRTITITDGNGRQTRIEVNRNGQVTTENVVGADGLARLRELSALQGIAAPAAPRPRRALPDGLVDLVTVVVTFVGIVSIGTPFAKAMARRIERRGESRVPDEVARRLAAIEQAVESVAIEVERISEGQRFTTKLLAERQPVEVER